MGRRVKDYSFDEDGWPTSDPICRVQGPNPAYQPSTDGALRCRDFNYDYNSPNWQGDGGRVWTARGLPDACEYSYATNYGMGPLGNSSNMGFDEYSLPRPTPNPQKITQHDYVQAAATLGVDVAAIKAVAEQETRGAAFDRKGRPTILFEGHKFSMYAKHKFDLSNEDLSFRYPKPTQTLNQEQMDALITYVERKHLKITNPKIGSKMTKDELKYLKKQHHSGDQYEKLERAISLDWQSALLSCSWGKFQIMGFEFKKCGCHDVTEFVKHMFSSEYNHLNAFINFVKHKKHCLPALKHHNWLQFSISYNGSDQNSNNYAKNIGDYFNDFIKYPNKIPGDIL